VYMQDTTVAVRSMVEDVRDEKREVFVGGRGSGAGGPVSETRGGTAESVLDLSTGKRSSEY